MEDNDPVSLRAQIRTLRREIGSAVSKKCRLDGSIKDREKKLHRLEAHLAMCESGRARPAMA